MKNTIILSVLLLLGTTLFGQDTPKAIHVEVSGQGPAVLLIPGFTVPGNSWDSVVSTLEKNYECHVVTLAGFGGKAPISFPWLPQVNEALINYITQNNLQDLSIIGHSLGGTIAVRLANQESAKISKLILVDALPAAGAIMFPNFDPNTLAYKSPYNDQQLAMSNEDFKLLAGNMSKGMSLTPSAQVKIESWILEADRKTYVYGYTDYLKLDVREDLKTINIPVTVLAAEQPFGKEAALQTYKSQYANLEDYNLIMAENSAHFIMFDQPEWFLNQLETSLSSK